MLVVKFRSNTKVERVQSNLLAKIQLYLYLGILFVAWCLRSKRDAKSGICQDNKETNSHATISLVAFGLNRSLHR